MIMTVFMANHIHDFSINGNRYDIGRMDLTEYESHVDQSFFHQIMDFIGMESIDGQLDFWIFPDKILVQGQKGIIVDHIDAANPQMASLGRLMEQLGILPKCRPLLGNGNEFSAERCQIDIFLSFLPKEQFCIQLIFQRFDPIAYRPLGDKQILCCSRYIPLLHNSQKCFDFLQSHTITPNIRLSNILK